jgi:hypothetical protein
MKTKCKNKDGPPRLVRLLGAIGDRRPTDSRITGRQARHLLWRRMRRMRVMLTAMWTCNHFWVVVIVFIVVFVRIK